MTQAEFIVEQRAKGWVDFHPEKFCHKCGGPNLWSWWVDSVKWNIVQAVEEVTILCPQCFVERWEELTGRQDSWELRIDSTTDSR